MPWRRAAWVVAIASGCAALILAIVPFSITVPRGFGGPGPIGPDSVVSHCPSPLGVVNHPRRVDAECKEPGHHRIFWALGFGELAFLLTVVLFVTRRSSWAETQLAAWLANPRRRAVVALITLAALAALAVVVKNAADVPERTVHLL